MAIQIEGLSRWGLSHGDVHLGNLYALAPEKPGDNWKMFLCDFGMMIDESEAFRAMSLEVGLSFTYYWDGTIMGRAFAKQSTEPVSPKNYDKLLDHMKNAINKYFQESQEGGELVWQPIIQRGTQVTTVSDLTYGAATLGLKMAPENWLLLKNFAYLCNMASSMWTSFNPSSMWAPHCKKFVRDMILHDMEAKNVTNLRDSLPQLLHVVRERDRKEIMKALETFQPVKPMEQLWSFEWDVRELATPSIGGDGSDKA